MMWGFRVMQLQIVGNSAAPDLLEYKSVFAIDVN